MLTIQITKFWKASVALVAIGSLLLALTGCASSSKQDYGTWLGAIGGGIIGGAIDDGGAGGILIGTVAGGLLGRMIGSYMDASDRKKAAEALESTPTGETASWVNEDTGRHYSVKPTSDIYQAPAGNCREFQQEMFIDGERKVVTGTACKQAGDENWNITET